MEGSIIPHTALITIAASTGSGSVSNTPARNRIVRSTRPAVTISRTGVRPPALSEAADLERLPVTE